MNKSVANLVRERVREHGQTYKIYELCLDQISIGQFSLEIVSPLQKCFNLEYLTLQNCSIVSLLNLPNFSKLIQLQLDHNQIIDSQIKYIPIICPAIQILSLTNNLIDSLQSLKFLHKCEDIQKLFVANNPISNQPDNKIYTKYIYSYIPQLINVDWVDKNGNKIQEKQQSQAFSESEQDYSEQQEGSQDEVQSPVKQRKKI